MHRTLSRIRRHALWMLAASHLAAAGCQSSAETTSKTPIATEQRPALEAASAGATAEGGAALGAPEPRHEDLAASAGEKDSSATSSQAMQARAPVAPAPAAEPAADMDSEAGGLVGADTAGPGGVVAGSIGTGRQGSIGRAGKGAPARRSSRRSAKRRTSGGSAYGRGGGAMAIAQPPPPPVETANTEHYQDYGVNRMTATAEDALSTFAVDVDTASFVIARRKITAGTLPPPASVRVEEFINYFRYDYAGPTDGRPFAVHMDAAPSPFTPGRHLLRVGVQAKKLSLSERKTAHLVFLVDVSGSMQSADKIGLTKRALRILVDNLKDGDTVSLVTYAGSTRVVLEPTGLAHKGRILGAIEELSAGGSTNMGSGIQLAYDMAGRNLSPDSISRVIVLSDGDANVGNTGHAQILDTIRGHVAEGVTLSTIGFGMGNYKDTLMEQLANKGNGNYFYIDGMGQARRVFQEQLGGTLEVVAKDVKIQVELDPGAVRRYRLVGYENRDVADVDFRNDRVDAGEIGAGHTVTALYEVELTGKSDRLGTVRIRAKTPRGSKATEHAYPIGRDRVHASFEGASADFRFATAVMATAEILRRSPHAAEWSLDDIERLARAASTTPNRNARAERISFADMLARVRGMHGNRLTMAR